MPNCGGWRRTSGNLLPNTRPKLSQTNFQLACTNIADSETKDMNFEMETKIGSQTEDFMLPKDIIIENHRKPRDYKKEAFEKMFNNMKADDGHIAPRFHGTSNEKFGTTKDKMLAIEDCTDVKARPSIKSNKVRPSIKQNEVRAIPGHPVATLP